MSSILSKAKTGSRYGGRPPAAVEFAPEGVLAASLPGKGQTPTYAFAPLTAGALTPGVSENNLLAPEAVTAAIRTALGLVSPRSRSVTVVLPDTVVRVFVLDFDTLPAKAAEAIPVLRFRLRKMVPFDSEHAGVSYQILSQNKTECRVLTAVVPNSIRAEYESAVRSAGFEPGAVLPSALAALAALDTEEPLLAACLTRVSLTTSITRGEDLLLYRTLELPEEPEQRLAEVQRGIAVAAAYFEDKLGARATHLHYAGNGSAEEFARWINYPELTVVELAPRPEVGAATVLGNLNLAGVTGALAGAN